MDVKPEEQLSQQKANMEQPVENREGWTKAQFRFFLAGTLRKLEPRSEISAFNSSPRGKTHKPPLLPGAGLEG